VIALIEDIDRLTRGCVETVAMFYGTDIPPTLSVSLYHHRLRTDTSY